MSNFRQESKKIANNRKSETCYSEVAMLYPFDILISGLSLNVLNLESLHFLGNINVDRCLQLAMLTTLIAITRSCGTA